MFWGINLKANRKYTQTTTRGFHISSAALDSSTATDGDVNQIFISCEGQKFLVCTLRKNKTEQVILDLNFDRGEEICFQSMGSGNVTLCGYLIEGPNDDISDDFDLREVLEKKKQSQNRSAQEANGEAEDDDDDEGNDDDDDDDDDDDSDAAMDGILEEQADDDDEEDDDDDDDDDEDEDEDDDEEDDSEEEEVVVEPKPKVAKMEKSKNQQNGVGKQASAEKNKKDDKVGKQQQANQKAKKENTQKTNIERTLAGGLKVVDLKIGTGPEVKDGKRVHVYYEGRFKSNNKVFDSLRYGKGFKFAIGRGEVIKGWDIGVTGMKVGGKRRIVCPPHMAYGARGNPPHIPPNSTLVFEVEVKSVI